jgi:hypothetical protein
VEPAAGIRSGRSALARFPVLQDQGAADLSGEASGHARCIACHGSGTPLRLQPLPTGSTSWSDEDSRKNFEAVQRVVAPGNLKSRLLIHPLDEKAGGDFYHSGGKHWSSQDEAEWQTLKAWVLGQTK